MWEWIVIAWEWAGKNVASIIAVCAAFLTLYQARIARKHNIVSTTPDLAAFTERNDQNLDPGGPRVQVSHQVRLMNLGLGPARITGVSLTADGAPVDLRNVESVFAAVNRVLGYQTTALYVFHITGPMVLPSREGIVLLSLSFPAASSAEGNGILGRLDRLRLVADYQSVYGKSFRFDSRATRWPE